MDTDCRIILTQHARERMREAQLHYKQAIWMLQTAQEEKHFNRKLKDAKYNNDQVTYWRNGSVIFTVIPTKSKFDPTLDIILVLTLTDQQTVYKPWSKRGLLQAKRRASYEENSVEYDREG